jgi:hypothetical protein
MFASSTAIPLSHAASSSTSGWPPQSASYSNPTQFAGPR